MMILEREEEKIKRGRLVVRQPPINQYIILFEKLLDEFKLVYDAWAFSPLLYHEQGIADIYCFLAFLAGSPPINIEEIE